MQCKIREGNGAGIGEIATYPFASTFVNWLVQWPSSWFLVLVRSYGTYEKRLSVVPPSSSEPSPQPQNGSHERQPSLPPRRRPVPSVGRCLCRCLSGGHGRVVVPFDNCGLRWPLGGDDAGICLAGHGSFCIAMRGICRQPTCSTSGGAAGAIHEQKVQEERRR